MAPAIRRALNIISNRSSSANELELAHFAAIKVTSERINLFRPLYSTSGEETGYTVSLRSSEADNNARVQRLAQSFVNELQYHFGEARLAHSQSSDAANSPFSVEVEMLFEVGDSSLHWAESNRGGDSCCAVAMGELYD